MRSSRFGTLPALLLGALVGLSAAAEPLAAQHLQDPLVPTGRLRLGFAPSFTSWDSRYGLRMEGSTVVEEEEALGLDLTDPTGVSLFPGITALRDELRALIEDPGYAPVVGNVSGIVTKNVTRLDFSLHVGVFDWLTVGGTLPWIKTRTAVDVAYRPDGADLGLNPLLESNAAVSSYLERLAGAAGAAEARADAACAADPAGGDCAAARALAARMRSFAERTRAAYLASAFFPVAGSAAGQALTERARALSEALTAAGLGTLRDPLLAAGVLDEETFVELPLMPAAGIRASELESVDPLWAAGDLELDVAVRLLDGEVRDSGSLSPRLAWTLVGGGLLRLGTGSVDDPDILLDVGTGDGQTDVEGFLFGHLRVGARLGVRAEARYGVQGPVTLLRRVAPHEQLLAPANALRAVRWTPGNYLDLTVSPRYWLDETLSVALDYRRFHKAADAYELAARSESGVDPDPTLLARETEQTLSQLALGLRYSTLADWRAGMASPPVEVSVRLVLPAGGSGGQTPRAFRGDLGIRLFRSLWGN